VYRTPVLTPGTWKSLSLNDEVEFGECLALECYVGVASKVDIQVRHEDIVAELC
jgi:hypothetical protein